MDGQDHKKPVTSTGHEVHGVHNCHRCGWPFPNPHPSARHRRAHKRVCGKVEGYKVIQSDLAVSDDEHASDDDEHTPSPKVEKTKVNEYGSSGGIGEKSNKSEDDVFSDAVTEFSESGISPSLEERLEKGVDKSLGQKCVEGFANTIQVKVDESAETTEQLYAPTTSGQTCNHGALVNAIDQSGSVIPINDTGTDAVSAGLSNPLPSDIIKSDTQKNVDIQVGDELACVSLDSEEGKNSHPAVMATERKDELCGKLDGSTSISSATNFTAVENNSELEGVKVPVAEKYDASVIRAIGSEDVECSVSNVLAIPSTGSFDPVSVVSSTDEEVKLETGLSGGENDGNFDVSEEAKCTTTGNENINQESKNKFSAESVSAPDSDTSFALKDDQIVRTLKEDSNDNDEKSNCKLLEPEMERCKRPTTEAQATLDSAMQSVNSTELLSSGEVGGDARQVEGLSKPGASELESRDHVFQRFLQATDTGKVTEVLQSVGSAGLDIGLNHEVGDVGGAKSLGVAGMGVESSHSGDVGSSERTPEHPISQDCGNLLSESEFLEGNSATDSSCIHDDAKASDSVDAAKVVVELKCEGSAVDLFESSDSLTLTGQEHSSVNQKCLTETDAEKRHTTEDVSPAGIASCEELTCHDNAVTPDKLLASSLCIEPVPSPSDHQVLHENHTNGDGKSIDDSGNITGIDSKSLQDKGGDNLIKEEGSVSTMDVLGGSTWRTDSLEGKWGSVSAVSSQSNMAAAETNSQSSEKSETNLQNAKTTNIESHRNKSDDFEPPSFMTLVQSGGEGEGVATASEIETVQSNQQLKSEALKAGWFPTLTNVVNESEGRKKNEETIAKVTNWSPGKHHSPLKNLLNEAKSPNTKQVPAANQGDDIILCSILDVVAHKDPVAHQEEWNSPARYPTEIKKEKKRGKPYWVPFVCCSSVNRDM